MTNEKHFQGQGPEDRLIATNATATAASSVCSAKLTVRAVAMVIRHVFDQTLDVAGQTCGLFELTRSVVRLELSHLCAQLTLPAAALVLLHTSHAQPPHHRLSEGLRCQL